MNETPEYPKTEKTQSESISNLITALSQAQTEYKPIKKTSKNPFFNSKYAPLDSVIDATKEALKKYGLAVVQMPEQDTLKTIIAHKSGEWMSFLTPLHAEKRGPQGYASSVTYARRYSLSSVLNCASEDDDDGNVAEHQKVIETSIPKTYKELSAKADTLEKWEKLGEWLKKNSASAKMMKQYNEEMTLWKQAAADSDDRAAFMGKNDGN